MNSICTVAWRLRGLTGSDPGFLILDGRNFKFQSTAYHVMADISEIEDIRYPWYYFGGGFKCTIRREQFRFSLVMPNNGVYPDNELAGDHQVLSQTLKQGMGYTLSESIGSVADGRKMMRECRLIFESYRPSK